MPSKKGVKCIDPGSGTNWPLGPTSLWHWQVTLPLSPQFQLWDKGTNNTFLILLDSIGKYSRVFSDILTNTNHWYVLSVKFLCYGKKLGFPPPVLGKTHFFPTMFFVHLSISFTTHKNTSLLTLWVTKCVAVIFPYQAIVCNISWVFYNLTQFDPELVSDFMG